MVFVLDQKEAQYLTYIYRSQRTPSRIAHQLDSPRHRPDPHAPAYHDPVDPANHQDSRTREHSPSFFRMFSTVQRIEPKANNESRLCHLSQLSSMPPSSLSSAAVSPWLQHSLQLSWPSLLRATSLLTPHPKYCSKLLLLTYSPSHQLETFSSTSAKESSIWTPGKRHMTRPRRNAVRSRSRKTPWKRASRAYRPLWNVLLREG